MKRGTDDAVDVRPFCRLEARPASRSELLRAKRGGDDAVDVHPFSGL